MEKHHLADAKFKKLGIMIRLAASRLGRTGSCQTAFSASTDNPRLTLAEPIVQRRLPRIDHMRVLLRLRSEHRDVLADHRQAPRDFGIEAERH